MAPLRAQLSRVKNSALRTILQARGNPTGASRPVFLIGAGRSGTSMMVLQLGKSWQVDVFNENHPAAFRNWYLEPNPVIARLVAESRAPVALFKPILETYRAQQLLADFPDSRLLFAFRHFDDVIPSSIKKFGPEDRLSHLRAWMADDFQEYAAAPPPPASRNLIRSLWRPDCTAEDAAALFWLFTNRLYFDLGLEGEPRVLPVQYEALATRPEAGLRRICAFLGLAFDARMLEGISKAAVRRSPASALDPDIRTACEDLWAALCRSADLVFAP